MPSTNKSPTEQYEVLHPTYHALSVKLKTLLIDLLDGSQIKYQLVESRAKDVASFSEKIKRPGKLYKDPLKDITDLCGCRIIVYYSDDVDKVSELIKNEFKVIEEKLTRQPNLLDVDRFGYISAHYIISVNDPRSGLIEWVPYQNLLAEVQIRTIIQHAWSAVSHALQYKQEASVPSNLQRRLYRIAGLFELADEEFVAIRGIREDLQIKVREEIKSNLENVNLSPTSIIEFIDTWEGMESLRSAVIAAGFSYTPEDKHGLTSTIYDLAVLSGISNLGELAAALKDIPHDYLRRVIEINSPWRTSDDFNIVICLVYYARERVNAKWLSERKFDMDIATVVIDAIE